MKLVILDGSIQRTAYGRLETGAVTHRLQQICNIMRQILFYGSQLHDAHIILAGRTRLIGLYHQIDIGEATLAILGRKSLPGPSLSITLEMCSNHVIASRDRRES